MSMEVFFLIALLCKILYNIKRTLVQNISSYKEKGEYIMKEKAKSELNEVAEQLLLSDLLQVLSFAKAFLNRKNKELKRKNDLK